MCKFVAKNKPLRYIDSKFLVSEFTNVGTLAALEEEYYTKFNVSDLFSLGVEDWNKISERKDSLLCEEFLQKYESKINWDLLPWKFYPYGNAKFIESFYSHLNSSTIWILLLKYFDIADSIILEKLDFFVEHDLLRTVLTYQHVTMTLIKEIEARVGDLVEQKLVIPFSTNSKVDADVLINNPAWFNIIYWPDFSKYIILDIHLLAVVEPYISWYDFSYREDITLEVLILYRNNLRWPSALKCNTISDDSICKLISDWSTRDYSKFVEALFDTRDCSTSVLDSILAKGSLLSYEAFSKLCRTQSKLTLALAVKYSGVLRGLAKPILAGASKNNFSTELERTKLCLLLS